MDEDLEYSFQISTPDQEMPTQVAIKNTGESKIEKISINIVATQCFDGLLDIYPYDRQENLEIFDLSPQEIVKQYLYNIPRDNFWYLEGTNSVIKSFEGIYIYLLSKKKSGITQECNSKSGFSIFFSRRFEEKEEDWETKWEKKYHVGLLNKSKQHFWMSICCPIDYWSRNNRGGIPVRLKQKLTSLLYILIQHKWIVSLLFWVCLLSNRINLDNYK